MTTSQVTLLDIIAQCPAKGPEVILCLDKILSELLVAQHSSKQIVDFESFSILYTMRVFEVSDTDHPIEKYLSPLLMFFERDITVDTIRLFGENILSCIDSGESDFKKESLLKFYMKMIDIARTKSIEPQSIFPLTNMTLYKFMDHLLTSRNIILQSQELELLHALLPDINGKVAASFFPEKALLQTAFIRFKQLPFKTTVRTFINCLNSQHDDIFSLVTEFITIGGKQYGRDERTYVEFNRTKEWVILHISTPNRNKAPITVKRSSIELVHSKEYQRINAANIQITLKNALKIQELGHTKTKMIKFRFNLIHLENSLIFRNNSFLNLFFGNLTIFRNPKYFGTAASESSRNLPTESSIKNISSELSFDAKPSLSYTHEKLLSTTYLSQLNDSVPLSCSSCLSFTEFSALCASSPIEKEYSTVDSPSETSQQQSKKTVMVGDDMVSDVTYHFQSTSNEDDGKEGSDNAQKLRPISSASERNQSSSLNEISSIGTNQKTDEFASGTSIDDEELSMSILDAVNSLSDDADLSDVKFTSKNHECTEFFQSPLTPYVKILQSSADGSLLTSEEETTLTPNNVTKLPANNSQSEDVFYSIPHEEESIPKTYEAKKLHSAKSTIKRGSGEFISLLDNSEHFNNVPNSEKFYTMANFSESENLSLCNTEMEEIQEVSDIQDINEASVTKFDSPIKVYFKEKQFIENQEVNLKLPANMSNEIEKMKDTISNKVDLTSKDTGNLTGLSTSFKSQISFTGKKSTEEYSQNLLPAILSPKTKPKESEDNVNIGIPTIDLSNSYYSDLNLALSPGIFDISVLKNEDQTLDSDVFHPEQDLLKSIENAKEAGEEVMIVNNCEAITKPSENIRILENIVISKNVDIVPEEATGDSFVGVDYDNDEEIEDIQEETTVWTGNKNESTPDEEYLSLGSDKDVNKSPNKKKPRKFQRLNSRLFETAENSENFSTFSTSKNILNVIDNIEKTSPQKSDCEKEVKYDFEDKENKTEDCSKSRKQKKCFSQSKQTGKPVSPQAKKQKSSQDDKDIENTLSLDNTLSTEERRKSRYDKIVSTDQMKKRSDSLFVAQGSKSLLKEQTNIEKSTSKQSIQGRAVGNDNLSSVKDFMSSSSILSVAQIPANCDKDQNICAEETSRYFKGKNVLLKNASERLEDDIQQRNQISDTRPSEMELSAEEKDYLTCQESKAGSNIGEGVGPFVMAFDSNMDVDNFATCQEKLDSSHEQSISPQNITKKCFVRLTRCASRNSRDYKTEKLCKVKSMDSEKSVPILAIKEDLQKSSVNKTGFEKKPVSTTTMYVKHAAITEASSQSSANHNESMSNDSSDILPPIKRRKGLHFSSELSNSEEDSPTKQKDGLNSDKRDLRQASSQHTSEKASFHTNESFGKSKEMSSINFLANKIHSTNELSCSPSSDELPLASLRKSKKTLTKTCSEVSKSGTESNNSTEKTACLEDSLMDHSKSSDSFNVLPSKKRKARVFTSSESSAPENKSDGSKFDSFHRKARIQTSSDDNVSVTPRKSKGTKLTPKNPKFNLNIFCKTSAEVSNCDESFQSIARKYPSVDSLVSKQSDNDDLSTASSSVGPRSAAKEQKLNVKRFCKKSIEISNSDESSVAQRNTHVPSVLANKSKELSDNDDLSTASTSVGPRSATKKQKFNVKGFYKKSIESSNSDESSVARRNVPVPCVTAEKSKEESDDDDLNAVSSSVGPTKNPKFNVKRFSEESAEITSSDESSFVGGNSPVPSMVAQQTKKQSNYDDLKSPPSGAYLPIEKSKKSAKTSGGKSKRPVGVMKISPTNISKGDNIQEKPINKSSNEVDVKNSDQEFCNQQKEVLPVSSDKKFDEKDISTDATMCEQLAKSKKQFDNDNLKSSSPSYPEETQVFNDTLDQDNQQLNNSLEKCDESDVSGHLETSKQEVSTIAEMTPLISRPVARIEILENIKIPLVASDQKKTDESHINTDGALKQTEKHPNSKEQNDHHDLNSFSYYLPIATSRRLRETQASKRNISKSTSQTRSDDTLDQGKQEVNIYLGKSKVSDKCRYHLTPEQETSRQTGTREVISRPVAKIINVENIILEEKIQKKASGKLLKAIDCENTNQEINNQQEVSLVSIDKKRSDEKCISTDVDLKQTELAQSIKLYRNNDLNSSSCSDNLPKRKTRRSNETGAIKKTMKERTNEIRSDATFTEGNQQVEVYTSTGKSHVSDSPNYLRNSKQQTACKADLNSSSSSDDLPLSSLRKRKTTQSELCSPDVEKGLSKKSRTTSCEGAGISCQGSSSLFSTESMPISQKSVPPEPSSPQPITTGKSTLAEQHEFESSSDCSEIGPFNNLLNMFNGDSSSAYSITLPESNPIHNQPGPSSAPQNNDYDIHAYLNDPGRQAATRASMHRLRDLVNRSADIFFENLTPHQEARIIMALPPLLRMEFIKFCEEMVEDLKEICALVVMAPNDNDSD